MKLYFYNLNLYNAYIMTTPSCIFKNEEHDQVMKHMPIPSKKIFEISTRLRGEHHMLIMLQKVFGQLFVCLVINIS